MLGAMTLLLVCQTIGEIVCAADHRAAGSGHRHGLAVCEPGAALRRAAPATLTTTAQQLLTHLSLLLVPAGVGVMLHFERLRAEWSALSITLLASTVLTIAAAALVM